VNVEPENPSVLTEEPDDPMLGIRQERMILALLEHATNEKAATGLGISTVTLWRAMQKPEFAEAFRKARREAFSQSVARLQHASNAVVGTLLRVMTDREARAASRVRAADVVLQTALRGIEMEDLEARLDRLERSAEASNGGRRF
jgi:hypothetical protein